MILEASLPIGMLVFASVQHSQDCVFYYLEVLNTKFFFCFFRGMANPLKRKYLSKQAQHSLRPQRGIGA